jgi:hypothetical protein
MTRWIAGLLIAGLALAPLAAQGSKTYRTRLSPVPVAAFNTNIVGTGGATGTVAGSTLNVAGTYAGLASPATQAKIFKSPKPGIRGEALFDLQVSGGTTGTISGKIDLSAAQLQELAQGRYYIQLYSEKAADGNLWGWLQPQENRR